MAASPENALNPVLSSSPTGVWRLLANRPMPNRRQPQPPLAPSTRAAASSSALFEAPDVSNPVRIVRGPPLASRSSSGITFTTPPRAAEPYSTLAGPRITSTRRRSGERRAPEAPGGHGGAARRHGGEVEPAVGLRARHAVQLDHNDGSPRDGMAIRVGDSPRQCVTCEQRYEKRQRTEHHHVSPRKVRARSLPSPEQRGKSFSAHLVLVVL